MTQQSVPLWGWVVFNLFVLAMLALDLGVLHRKSHVVKIKEALSWSAVWIALALIFSVGVYQYLSPQKSIEFLTGYVIEKALSVDNIFVFLLIFGYFKVSPIYQHKVLFWGIIGALIMRAIMITAGVALIHRFEWIIYVFGAFLIFTGIKMAFSKEVDIDPGHNPLVNAFKRFMPVTPEYHGDKFFVNIDGRRFATPLFVVVLVVETTDLIFAVDSIPAILAVSRDPFIVYTSNVFAILGLRALYFALAGVMDLFHYLKMGLAVVLSFVGVKMLLSHTPYKIPTEWSLVVVTAVLVMAVIASLLWPQKHGVAEDLVAMGVVPNADKPSPEPVEDRELANSDAVPKTVSISSDAARTTDGASETITPEANRQAPVSPRVSRKL